MTHTDSVGAEGTISPDAPLEQEKAKVPHAGLALVLILTAQLMVVLDSTIANIALPYIGSDLGISQANLTWIVTGYALAFGGLLLLGGRLGDLYGRRLLFMTGLTVFAVGSLLGGLAQNEALLLGSRGLQGVGAALAAPAALALITTTFPAGPQRNRAMAAYATMSGIGAAIGLILGGWLTGLDQPLGVDGWRLTFLINVPIGLLAAFAAPRVLKESERHTGWLDIPGAITGTLGLLGIVFGLSRAGEEAYGWDHMQTIGSLAAGVALLVAFLVIESRVDHPLLPMRIFANRTRATSFVAMMIAPAAMFSMFFYLSLFIQQIMGFSPLEAGFAFLPFSFGIVIGAAALVQPGRPDRTALPVRHRHAAGGDRAVHVLADQRRRQPVGDPRASAAGESIGSDVNYWTSLFPYILLMAIGMGMVFVPLTLTAVHHVKSEDSGIGSGVLNTMQQVGGALGLAILSTVALHFSNNRGDEIAGPLKDGFGQAGSGTVPGTDLTVLDLGIFQGTFTSGAQAAFLVGSFMMLAASAVIWIFLNVKHTELATDAAEGPVHVG